MIAAKYVPENVTFNISYTLSHRSHQSSTPDAAMYNRNHVEAVVSEVKAVVSEEDGRIWQEIMHSSRK